MLLRIAGLFNVPQVRMVRDRLEDAGGAWVDGRITAGHQGAPVKHNLQLAEDAPIARELSSVVVAALSEDLKHSDAGFRGRAARALGSFGPEAKSATPLLADMLKTEDYFWRHVVVQTLEKIGPGASEAVPALLSVLNDRVGYIRVAAEV